MGLLGRGWRCAAAGEGFAPPGSGGCLKKNKKKERDN